MSLAALYIIYKYQEKKKFRFKRPPFLPPIFIRLTTKYSETYLIFKMTRNPIKSNKPNKPNKSTQPTKPTKPVKPVKSTKPVEPVEPTKEKPLHVPGALPDDSSSDEDPDPDDSSSCSSPCSSASGWGSSDDEDDPSRKEKEQLEAYISQAQQDNETQSPRHLINAIASGNESGSFDAILERIDMPTLTGKYTTGLKQASVGTLTWQFVTMYMSKSLRSGDEPRFRSDEDAEVFGRALTAGNGDSDEIDKSHAVLRVLALLCRGSGDEGDEESDDEESDDGDESGSDSGNEDMSNKRPPSLKEIYNEMLEKVLRKYHQNDIPVPADLFVFYHKVLKQCGPFLERIWRHNIALAGRVLSAETDWQDEKHCNVLQEILGAIIAEEGYSDDTFETDYGQLVRFVCLFNNRNNKLLAPWTVVAKYAMENGKPGMLRYALREGGFVRHSSKHTRALLEKAIADSNGAAIGDIVLFIRDSQKKFDKFMRDKMFGRT